MMKDIPQLERENVELISLVEKWISWEADWLECNEVWYNASTGEPKYPQLTGELYDSYVELQQEREILMEEMNGKST